MVGVPMLRPESYSRSFPKKQHAQIRKSDVIKHTGEHGPYRAQQMSSDRLRRLKPVKIVSGPALRALVRGRLDARRSPERISGWLRGPLACTRNRPQSPSGPITTETGTVAGPVGADSGGGCNAR